MHNAVLVARDFCDCDRDRALEIVSSLMIARLDLFEHAAAVEIPALADQLRLPASTRAALDRHVQELRDWMTGILHWHRNCARYTEAELRRRQAARLGRPGPAAAPWTVRAAFADGGDRARPEARNGAQSRAASAPPGPKASFANRSPINR